MSYTNNNGTLPSPQFITTIDLTVTNRTKFVKYFNYNVFNFAKQYSDPLILPFNVTVDVIYHGDIDIGSSKFRSTTFAVDTVIGNKFHITGEGTAYFWYRYGSIDPASFDLIAQTAINHKDWIVLDAILHTRSFVEVIDFIVNNPQTMGIFAEGIDWQLNEIGAQDFFAYLTGNVYDTRKLAQFLTILAYIDPGVLTEKGIPVYNYDNPNRSFEAYMNYLPTSFIVPIESEISEQGSEISDLFSITSEQASEIAVQMYQIMTLFAQSSEQQSEIDVIDSEITVQESEIDDLYKITSEQQSEINEIDSELVVQGSEINDLFGITSEQASEISDLFVITSEITSDLDILSENLILFTDAGKIVNEVLAIFHWLQAVMVVLKILQHVVKTIAPVSELGIVSDLGDVLNSILGITSEGVSYVTSELNVEGIVQDLVNLLNGLLGIHLSVSNGSSSSDNNSSQSSDNNSSQSSNSGGGLFGLNLGLNL